MGAGRIFKVIAIVAMAGTGVYFGVTEGVPVLKRWFGKGKRSESGNGDGTDTGTSTDIFTSMDGVNNPGNIMNAQAENGNWINHIYFLGEIDTTGKPMRSFDTPVNGYAAILQQLDVYYHEYDAKTLRQMITRYAPPEHNPTENYIAQVANKAGVQENADARVWTDNEHKAVIREIAKFEQGSNFVPDEEQINEAYQLRNNKARIGVNEPNRARAGVSDTRQSR